MVSEVPPALDPRIVILLMHFADLTQLDQTHFLDVVNAYLYASPQRRTRLRKSWEREAQSAHQALPARQQPCLPITLPVRAEKSSEVTDGSPGTPRVMPGKTAG